MTDVWQARNVKEGKEYAILTNEIYKEWPGMSAKEYKQYKGLRKESLRDNMSDIENANRLNYKYIDDKEKIENK